MIRKKLLSKSENENQLIWWPPESVLELARLAVDSGGDPDAIHRALDPSIIPVRYILLNSFFEMFNSSSSL